MTTTALPSVVLGLLLALAAPGRAAASPARQDRASIPPVRFLSVEEALRALGERGFERVRYVLDGVEVERAVVEAKGLPVAWVAPPQAEPTSADVDVTLGFRIDTTIQDHRGDPAGPANLDANLGHFYRYVEAGTGAAIPFTETARLIEGYPTVGKQPGDRIPIGEAVGVILVKPDLFALGEVAVVVAVVLVIGLAVGYALGKTARA